MKKPSGKCVSVGYLVHKTADAVTIAQSISYDAAADVREYGHALTIPRGALLGEPRELAPKPD